MGPEAKIIFVKDTTLPQLAAFYKDRELLVDLAASSDWCCIRSSVVGTCSVVVVSVVLEDARNAESVHGIRRVPKRHIFLKTLMPRSFRLLLRGLQTHIGRDIQFS